MSDERRPGAPWWLFDHVVKPVHLRLREVMSVVVDRRLGVRTTDEPVAAALEVDIQLFRRTQRSMGWTGVLRIVRRLDLAPDDVFLDIGCGAGRVMCGAARRPLARVIGIDLDERVLELARANAASLRGRRAEMVAWCADATTFEVPDDVTVVFLYNPFGGAVLEACVAQLLASIERSPRTVRVAYANPKEPAAFLGTGAFRQVGSMSLGWRPGENWHRSQRIDFYESSPSDASARSV